MDTLPANRLRNLAQNDRPQERLQKLGPSVLSDSELLAMILRSGTRGHDVVSLSTQIIHQAGSLAGLITWTPKEFTALKGIGRVKALQLVTVMEIARRVLGQQIGESPLIERADHVYNYLAPITAGLEVEKFWVLCLNRRNRLIKRVEITSGTATSSLFHPREVFREAIRENAVNIICVHNHPSGDPSPSAADIRATRALREAARTIEIELLDHVIVGHPSHDPLGTGYYSFRSAGLL